MTRKRPFDFLSAFIIEKHVCVVASGLLAWPTPMQGVDHEDMSVTTLPLTFMSSQVGMKGWQIGMGVRERFLIISRPKAGRGG